MSESKIQFQARLSKKLMNQASARLVPLSGTFELTPMCNFSCKMCYVRKSKQEVQSHNRPMVSLEQWLKIAQQAREQGLLYLLLTGGEPFLWPDFWTLYEKLVRMGFLISINTNGSLINDDAINRLKELPPTRINITLYGASDDTYKSLCGVKDVFSRVDYAIAKLQAAGILVKLNCSLTPQNACDLDAIVRYAQKKNLVLQVTTYMFPPLRRDPSMIGKNERFTPYEAAYYHVKCYSLQHEKEEYLQFLRNVSEGLVLPQGLDESCIDPIDGRIRCRAGKAAFWITWDGWMSPCGMMPEPKVNIFDRSFYEVWHAVVRVSDDLRLSGVCAKCKNQLMCHSCAAMAVSETGSSEGIPQYLCQMVMAMKAIAREELKSMPESK